MKNPCPQWQRWSEWSQCSTSCGKGAQIRARACTGRFGSCQGKATETKDCLLVKCQRKSQWQEWGAWSVCSTTCGKGAKIRARACSGRFGSCPGKATETKGCLQPECGGITSEWQEWGEWSECSTSCGKGSKIRARTCSGDIGTCLAESAETKDCQEAKCPGCLFCIFLFFNHIPGPVKPSKWQKWGPWSHCSTTCGKGHRVRARACSGSHGSCPGEPTETKDCLLTDCPGFLQFFLRCKNFQIFAFFLPPLLLFSMFDVKMFQVLVNSEELTS